MGVEHAVEPPGLVDVAVDAVGDFFGRVAEEVVCLGWGKGLVVSAGFGMIGLILDESLVHT